MTTNRKCFLGGTILILGIDCVIHFYGQLQKILVVANEPPGWPHFFSWIANALVVLAWNTFAETATTLLTPLGIIAMVIFFCIYPVTASKRPAN